MTRLYESFVNCSNFCTKFKYIGIWLTNKLDYELSAAKLGGGQFYSTALHRVIAVPCCFVFEWGGVGGGTRRLY